MSKPKPEHVSVALLVVAQNQKHPSCPWTGQCLNKLIHPTMVYYSAVKRKKLSCNNLDAELKKSPKVPDYITPFLWHSQNDRIGGCQE
jgi:hypothetical protein